MSKPVAKHPSACNAAELQEFEALVLEGGEVTRLGLGGRVARAQCLAFLRRDQALVGIAGLKRPETTYRARISARSGVALPQDVYAFELGWVYLRPEIRGAGLSLPLCKPLIHAVSEEGVFATSRAANQGMHKTLAKLGFRRVGAAWPSGQSNDQVHLFLRDALLT